MPSIHFTSLVGVDLDTDIIPHWIKYYLAFGYDNYTVWLHSATNDLDKLTFARELFSKAGFDNYYVTGVFSDGGLRKRYLEPYHRTLGDMDIITSADSDEFQDISPSYASNMYADYARDILLNHEVVNGALVDRWDDTLHDVEPYIDIKTQYPYQGHLDEEIIARYSPEMPQLALHWPLCRREKIISCRARNQISYYGSHSLVNKFTNDETYKDSPLGVDVESHKEDQYNGVQVLHYSFRKSLFARMAGKSYYKNIQLMAHADFFGRLDPLPPEISFHAEVEQANQIAKGWIPCQSKATP